MYVIAIENSHTEKMYMYIMGKPKTDFELSNNSKSGMFNANRINIERIINFCSCLFFIEKK